MRKSRDVRRPAAVAPLDGESDAAVREFNFFRQSEAEIQEEAGDLIEEFWTTAANQEKHERVLEAVKKVENEVQLMQTLFLRNTA